jgi:hypothetical protein
MKPRFGFTVPLCLLMAGLSFTNTPTLSAQEQAGQVTPPPRVLEVITETLKPGQSGSPHQKTEAAFVQAFANAKWPTHYIGTDAVTGRQRAVFFVGYDSFADWQKDTEASQKDSTLGPALDTASINDGALLDSITTSAFYYHEDESLNAPVDISQMRYFDIEIFKVRAGHERDWDTLSKMYVDGFSKVPGVHWATWQKMYGDESGDVYIVVTPLKSLAEVDEEMTWDKKLHDAVGDAQMQKMLDLGASTIESSESHLFAINPNMSYVSEDWIKASPDFWGQK